MYKKCIRIVLITMFTLSDYPFYKTDDDVTKRPHPEDDALSNPQHRRLLKSIEEENDRNRS